MLIGIIVMLSLHPDYVRTRAERTHSAPGSSLLTRSSRVERREANEPIISSFSNRIFIAPIVDDKEAPDENSASTSTTTFPYSKLNGESRRRSRMQAIEQEAEGGDLPRDAMYAIDFTDQHSTMSENVQQPALFSSLFRTHPVLAVLLCLLVTVLILATLIGNSMVCLAVVLVRKLKHQPANLLIVSLAVAAFRFQPLLLDSVLDAKLPLCLIFSVGLLVMPIALIDVLEDKWLLGALYMPLQRPVGLFIFA